MVLWRVAVRPVWALPAHPTWGVYKYDNGLVEDLRNQSQGEWDVDVSFRSEGMEFLDARLLPPETLDDYLCL